MRSLLFLMVGAFWFLMTASPTLANPTGKTVHKAVKSLSAEVAEFHAAKGELPEHYRRPRTDMAYKVTTYVGIECVFGHSIIPGTAPVVRIAWDFESDGYIDWESKDWNPSTHVFEKVSKQYATFYAFDVYGNFGRAEIPIQVLGGTGKPKVEPHTLKPSFAEIDAAGEPPPGDPGSGEVKSYFLLIADTEDWNWIPAVKTYHRLVDSLGCTDEDIVVVAGGSSDLTIYYQSYLEDTVIIDHRYTVDGMDSAFDYLLSSMTMRDDLHIISIAHGGGYADSSCLLYDPNYLYSIPSMLLHGRITAEVDDPDLFVLEEDFRLLIPEWRHYCFPPSSVGMDQWGITNLYPYILRHKRVATFHDMTFINSDKENDDDVFIEWYRQFLRGDTNHNWMIDTELGEISDFDGDGIPPLEMDGDSIIFDEDDWGDYQLAEDRSHTSPWGGTTFLPFDAGFDGKPDVCFNCDDFYPTPVVHGTDLDNDGVLDFLDVTRDGDLLDSVGVDEWTAVGYDNVMAAFLDNLKYRHVTVLMANCFSGGFINDLSRPNVLIATATVEGTVAWGTFFVEYVVNALTGGIFDDGETFEPATDRVVNFLEAYNAVGVINNQYYAGRVRLDDNGDRVGHLYPLPAEGDGDLAADLSWGTLSTVTTIPIPVWPLQDEETFDYTPTLVWSDTGDVDSFMVEWGEVDFSSGGIAVTLDTFFTLPFHVQPLPREDIFWHVKAYKGSRGMSCWSDSISFDVLVDYDCCLGKRGNLDGDPDDIIDENDLAFLSAYIWEGGPLPSCIPEGNVDGSTETEAPTVMDMAYLDNYLYHGGPAPVWCIDFVCGDVDGSGHIDILDFEYFRDYLYHGGPPPEPMEAGDVDCIPEVSIQDLEYLIAYLYQGGPAPCDCE